jgi:hypothetical protein
MGKWAGVLIVGCAVTLASSVLGVGTVGALVGLEEGGSSNSTITTSTQHFTTNHRVDLEDGPPPECDFPGAEATKVNESSTELEPAVTFEDSIGPATIIIGDRDNGGTAFEVLAGTTNLNVATTFETVVTQYFQATAAGESCAVLAAAINFTG